MERKKHFLYKDSKYLRKTHDRWMRGQVPINRDIQSDEFAANEELWLLQQCFKCQFYVPLEGVLGMDWGVCSHPSSPFASRLMFEHDSCEHHSSVSGEEL